MEQLEILLLNYFSVLFLTIALSIFVSKPDRISSFFSFWSVISLNIFALLMFKVIQIYDGFYVIYIANAFILIIFMISKVTINSQNKDKYHHIVKKTSSLHRLAPNEFANYITLLLKAYGFQSVQQVKIQNNDLNNTFDQYLLARHEGNLIEIRISNRHKKLTEKHINQLAAEFRNSTSQASSWLFATSATADETTNLHIRNIGADIKVFDLTTIYKLAYGLSPNYKPSQSTFHSIYLQSIDYLLAQLTKARSYATDKELLTHQSTEIVAPQKLLSSAMGESVEINSATIELFEDNGIESTTTETIPKKRKKKKNTSNENQGDLNLQSTGLNKQAEVINTPTQLIQSEPTAPDEPEPTSAKSQTSNPLQELIDDDHPFIPNTFNSNSVENDLPDSSALLEEVTPITSNDIDCEVFEEQDIQIEAEIDPTHDLTDLLSEFESNQNEILEELTPFEDDSLNYELETPLEINEHDPLNDPVMPTIEPTPEFEITIDMSDLGASIPIYTNEK